jgi:transposase
MTTVSPPTRFVALGIHRKYVVVGAADPQPLVVLTPSDAVVFEATANAWLFYDQLIPLVADVSVAHPQAVKLISAARVKTDSRGTMKLASLLAANLIPAV